jgi:hypothetical protein
MRNQLTRIISLLAAVTVLGLVGSILGLSAPAYASASAAAAMRTPAAAAATSAPALPDVYRWFYYGTYPTLHACLVAGSYQQLYVNTGRLMQNPAV